MASNYHSIVKKYLDQNRIGCSIPDYIQRGWNRIYTNEETEFNKRSCIIGSDVQIPNSVVRHRLGTIEIAMKANIETLRKAFELPEELLMNLSIDHKLPDSIEDEKLSFAWDDDDDDGERKRQKSVVGTIINKQREKRRKYEDYKYDYDNTEALPLGEIIEEIRTNIGKDLKSEDFKLITELMQIISRSKQDQVMNIYNELTDVHLISKFGGIPKLVQALQEIQKAFEQVAMKTNVASIETVIDVLFEKDDTYRVAIELLNTFTENVKKHKQQQQFILNNKSAQQGTLKRLTGSSEINQTITMGLMKKIDIDGLGAVIENLKEAHLEFDSITKLVQDLISMNNYIQTQSSIPIEQIQNQLAMAYFLETRHLSEQEIQELSRSATLYSIVHVSSLGETATKDECSIFLEHLKPSFIRICIQKILNVIRESSVDLNKVSNQFYNQFVIDLLRELIHGSEELNQNLLFDQVKKQLKKNKDLVDKIYRQMLKGKLVNIDTKMKLDTDKKKLAMVINEINRILNDKEDRAKQSKLMELLDKTDIIIPDRVKHWYQTKAAIQFPALKLKTGIIERKTKSKDQMNGTDIKAKSVRSNMPLSARPTRDKRIMPSSTTEKKGLTRAIQGQTSSTTSAISSKNHSERKKSSLKPLSRTHQTKEQSNTRTDSSTDKNGEKQSTNITQIIPTPTAKEQQKDTLVIVDNQPTKSSITTGAISIDAVSKREVDEDFTDHSQIPNASLPIPQETIEYSDSLLSKQGTSEERNDEQFSDYQPSQTIQTAIESIQNPAINGTTSDNIQTTSLVDSEPTIDVQFEVSQQSDDLNEKYADHDRMVSPLTKIEMFETDLELIQSQNTTSGKVGDNRTLNFELIHDAALLFYSFPPPNDPKQEVHTVLNGKILELITDSQYEKTKAQRVLAKATPSNNIRQQTERDTIGPNSSSTNLLINNAETISAVSDTRKLSGPLNAPADRLVMLVSTPSLDNIKSSTKDPRRTLDKPFKQVEDIYTSSLTNALRNLFSRSQYDTQKLRKIHDELIASGHISPLNEFYSSSNAALRVTLDHCTTYHDLIKWTLSLLQTTNKLNLIDFGHDLYSLAIDLDLTLTERLDDTRYAFALQENLKHELQTITQTDLREINSYLNASQLEKSVNISKKLNVTSKDRMIFDLYSLLLHLIQACHTFQPKYRPMQIHIREIAETFKSRAVADLAHKVDEIEERLAKIFAVTFFGASKRLNESRLILTK